MKRSNAILVGFLAFHGSVFTGRPGLAQGDVPDGFLHAWEGFADQVSPPGTYFLRYEIRGGAVGERVGDWKYPRSSCGGPIDLVETGGDSVTVNEEAPTFNDLGSCTYAPNTVRLKLIDGDHLSYDYNDTDRTRIVGTLTRIQAEFTFTGPDANGRIAVDASPTVPLQDTTIVDYLWDFGDGAVDAGIGAEHVYADAGRYVVRLTVTNDAFGMDKAEATVTVSRMRFLRGDANADGMTDLSDAVGTLSDLFLGTQKVPCQEAADANDDGALDLSDAVSLLGYLFLGGPAPGEPHGACGADPTPDGLTCTSFAGCP